MMTSYVVKAPNIKHIQIDNDELRYYEEFLTDGVLITLPVGQWVVMKIENNTATFNSRSWMYW